MEKHDDNESAVPSADDERQQTPHTRSVAQGKRPPRSYIFYCLMTMSVLLFTLTFAASELFSMFFSNVYPEKYLMSKFFGTGGSEDMALPELLLSQSFVGIPVSDITAALPDDTAAPVSSSAQTAGSDADPMTTPAADVVPPTVSPVPEGCSPIKTADLSLSQFGQNYIHNTSSVEQDMAALATIKLATDPAGVYPSGSPLVLILHTHGTEAYSEEGIGYYDPSREVARSDDIEKNVVAIGALMAEALNSRGIVTLHCETLHDSESYSGSYGRAAATVKRYLAEYPSIRYVIDVHRDAVISSSGALISPLCKTADGDTAQVMAVVGTGESSGGCPGYVDNLALAQRLRLKLNSACPTLCRPVCLRPSAYNQQYSPYSMLLEIGAAGNTMAQAERAARLTAQALADIILGL